MESRAAAARVRRTGVTSPSYTSVAYFRLSVNLCYGIAGGFYYEKAAEGDIRSWVKDA